MKNLDQIRASNALKTGKSSIKGKGNGEVIKKIPPVIQNHGLLAAAAYSCDDKNTGWKDAFAGIATHLSDPAIDLLPTGTNTADGLIQFLTRKGASSEELKLATAETLAWFNYARRFVKKK